LGLILDEFLICNKLQLLIPAHHPFATKISQRRGRPSLGNFMPIKLGVEEVNSTLAQVHEEVFLMS
jgi:hypothetical protein